MGYTHEFRNPPPQHTHTFKIKQLSENVNDICRGDKVKGHKGGRLYDL